MSKQFTLIALAIALLLAAAPAHARAPEGRKLTIGIVQMTDVIVYEDAVRGFREGLAGLGYERGKNLTIKRRVVLGETKGLWDKVQLLLALHRYVDEFIALKVDMVVFVGTPATEYGARRAADAGIPVMFIGVSMPKAIDDIAQGWITGSSTFVEPDRILNLVRALMPRARRLGFALSPDPNAQMLVKELRPLAEGRDFTVDAFDVDSNADSHKAAKHFRDTKPDVFLILPDTWVGRDNFVNANVFRDELLGPAKTPTVSLVFEAFDLYPEHVAISLGIPFETSGRMGAPIFDKLVNGAPPVEVPIVYPTKSDVRVHVQTARRSGIEVTGSLLKLATEVAE